MDLTDAQWAKLDPFFRPQRRADGKGRPWQDTRAVLNGVLWILRTGAPWHDLPDRYPPYQTCHRRFQQWQRSGLRTRQLQRREKRGSGVGPTKRGKGSKIVAIADRHGLPIAVHVASARPNEAILVEATLQQRFLREAPARLIGDKAYDSDPLDQRLRDTLGVQLISPHRWNRSKPVTQDGRALRRYRRRWKIERLFAWLHNFRRIVVRWEYHAENFLAMIQLACAVILLRHL